MAAVAVVGWLLREKLEGWAFVATAVGIIGLVATIFLNLYPRVMVSSISTAYDLTIANASSAPYTLKVMTIVALIFTPLVLVYQGWSYWVFRARVRRPPRAVFPIVDTKRDEEHRRRASKAGSPDRGRDRRTASTSAFPGIAAAPGAHQPPPGTPGRRSPGATWRSRWP